MVPSMNLNRPFETKRASLHLENRVCRKYSFQKLTQVSQANNVLDTPASNTDVFIWRDTRVSSAVLN
jgi:hypothetical protein